MGDQRKKKRRTATRNTSTAKSRHRSRTRRRRAGRNRRILTGVIAAAVLLLIVVAGVLAVKHTRRRKAEEEAARLAATDVMDMPFTAEDNTNTNTTYDSAAVPDAGNEDTAGTDAASSADASAAVHVSGIDAFALYEYDETTGLRVMTAQHASAWTRGEDIVSLEAFAADAENIVLSTGGGSAWYETWKAYWQQATGSEHCRIGYDVSFDLKNGEHIHAVLLKPGDELAYRDYLENYLYDDAANADAGWYSHLEPDDLSDDMLLTSIKFTPGERFEEIDGRITVTGFVYDALEDFDYDGNYIGDVSFTTEIVNQ